MLAIAIGTLFLAGICSLVAGGMLPLGVVVLYLSASLAAAIEYRLDKSAAQSGGWRTAERKLHILALIGGWPGALVAQRVFRHKSRKGSFRAVFVLTVIVNCGALVWFWAALR